MRQRDRTAGPTAYNGGTPCPELRQLEACVDNNRPPCTTTTTRTPSSGGSNLLPCYYLRNCEDCITSEAQGFTNGCQWFVFLSFSFFFLGNFYLCIIIFNIIGVWKGNRVSIPLLFVQLVSMPPTRVVLNSRQHNQPPPQHYSNVQRRRHHQHHSYQTRWTTIKHWT